MGKGSKKSVAAKNRRKAKNNEKRAKKEMEKAKMQINQSEIEEDEEYVYTGEVRSIDEIIEEMKTIQQKRKEFTERIQYDVEEEPIDRKMQQIFERERAEEADRKRELAYRKVVDKILRGEEER